MNHYTTPIIAYTGSFDPPHFGHVQTGEDVSANPDALHLLVLPRILFVPVAHSIQGKHTVPLEDRVEMTRLAILGKENLEVVNFDEGLERSITCYQRLLYMREGGINPIAWVIGSDTYTDERIEQLQYDQVVASGVVLVVVQRNGYRLRDLGTAHNGKSIKAFSKSQINNGEVILLEQSVPITPSSIEVKDALANGKDCSNLLPQQVFDYILKRGLYKAKVLGSVN